jgi:hypothetical protein
MENPVTYAAIITEAGMAEKLRLAGPLLAPTASEAHLRREGRQTGGVRNFNTTVAMTTADARKAEDKARKIAGGFKPAGG